MPTVLVIDDEPAIRQLCLNILAAAGYQVREAADGEQGLLSHRQEPADLILCDIFMPEKEGLETIKELRRECRVVRIVVMSGGKVNGMDFLKVALLFGADAAIAKPFEPAQLLAVVRAALSLSPASGA